MQNTTDSLVYNNVFSENVPVRNSYDSWTTAGDSWYVLPQINENIIGGPTTAGNFYSDYQGCDEDGDGLGDTETPFTNGGMIFPGDYYPLTNIPCQ